MNQSGILLGPGNFVKAISNLYNSSGTYAVGDYCTYDGYVWKCNTAISTAEEWTAAHWDKIKVTDEIATKFDKTNVSDSLTDTSTTKALSAAKGKALNESISLVKDYPTLGSFSTLAELNTLLNTALGTMTDYTCYSFRVTASATVYPFENTFVYHGTLHKNSISNYSYVILYPNANGYPITGYRLATTSWTYDRLLLKNEMKIYFHPGVILGSDDIKTLDDISTLLKNTYGTGTGKQWAVFFGLADSNNKITDGTPLGFYLALYNQSQSTLIRYFRTIKTGIVDMGDTETRVSDLENTRMKIKETSTITNINNYNLSGYKLLNSNSVENLPTANGQWYECFFGGCMQIASLYGSGNNGSERVYIRTYVNNVWVPWRRIDMPTSETFTVTKSSAVSSWECLVKKYGNMACITVNNMILTSTPSTTEDTVIGTLTGITVKQTTRGTGMDLNGKSLLAMVTADGYLKLSCLNNQDATTNKYFSIVFPCE